MAGVIARTVITTAKTNARMSQLMICLECLICVRRVFMVTCISLEYAKPSRRQSVGTVFGVVVPVDMVECFIRLLLLLVRHAVVKSFKDGD